AIKIGVDIPAHVAKVVDKGWRVGVPVAEDQSLVTFNPRKLERAPRALVELVVKAVRLARHRDQIAADIVSPAVIRAHENLGMAEVGAAKSHPAMTALIHEGGKRAVALAHDQHRVLRHVG